MIFFVIFFSQSSPGHTPFEITAYSLFSRVPAFILVLLLMEKTLPVRPKRDFIVLAAALPALIIIGFVVTFCAVKTGILPPEEIKAPAGISGWIAVIILSLSTGCLEEIFFRVYLPQRIMGIKPDQSRLSVAAAFIVSGLIFAFFHAYEGLWGIVNALLAAAVLSIAYIKSASFPGIALAHGLYNIVVFLGAVCT